MRSIFISLSVLLLLSSAVIVSGCGSDKGRQSGENDTLVTDSLDPEFQIQQLTQLIAQSPQNYELWRRRSLAWYESGDTRKAISDIDSAIKRFDTSPELWHLLGFYYFTLSEDSLALHFFRTSADLGSENPETYFQIGQVYFARKDYREAEKWYDTAILKDSLDPQYEFAKGFLYQAKGDMKKAVSYYNRALERDPGHIKSLAALHDLYKDHFKDLKTAQEYNARILQADSLHPIGRFNEGKHYQDLAEAISDTSKFEEYSMLMQLAIDEYSQAIRSDPGFVMAYRNRGVAAYYIDEYDLAIRDFEKVLELDPGDAVAHFYLGSIQEHFQEIEPAISHYREAYRLNPSMKEAKRAIDTLSRRIRG